MRKLIIWIIAMLLLVSTVNALGVTPGRSSTNFESGLERELTLKILNEGNKDVDISLTVEGELTPYIELNETQFSFSENEGERYVSYKLKLPESFDRPGLHKSKILVNEVSNDPEGGLVIGALVSVASQVYVNVPFPDKYLEADLNVLTEGSLAKFHVFIKNLGEDGINNVKGTIVVTKDGAEVSRKTTSLGSVGKFGRTELLDLWYGDDGNYELNVVVDYDGELIEFNRKFSIGTLIKPVAISVNDNFRLGEIAELGVLIENSYETDLSNVVAQLILKDDLGNTVVDVSSSSVAIGSKGRVNANIYWNTKEVVIGTYTGKLVLNFVKGTSERPVRADIQVDKIDIQLDSITGFAISNAEAPAKKDYGVWLPILFVMMGIILILVIVTNIRLMKYMKEKKK